MVVHGFSMDLVLTRPKGFVFHLRISILEIVLTQLEPLEQRGMDRPFQLGNHSFLFSGEEKGELGGGPALHEQGAL